MWKQQIVQLNSCWNIKNIFEYSVNGEERATRWIVWCVGNIHVSFVWLQKLTSINGDKCRPKEACKPLDFLKNVVPIMPEGVPIMWYITRRYKNATEARPVTDYSLLYYGCELLDRHVHVWWFDGEQVTQDEKDEEDDGDASGIADFQKGCFNR